LVRPQRLSFTAALLIAFGGDYGNLTEIAFALKMRNPMIGLDTWGIPGIARVATPREVMEIATDLLKQSDY
jgi:predicted Rossmann-fold nucleotide-binding protein